MLLIDFDPQAHATMGLNVVPSDLEKSIYDVITPQGDGSVQMDDILIPINPIHPDSKLGYVIPNRIDK